MSDIALREGSLEMLHTDHDNVLAFVRKDPKNPRRQVISLTNFSQDTVSVSILDTQQTHGTVTLSALGDRRTDESIDLRKPVVLPPDGAYLIDSAA